MPDHPSRRALLAGLAAGLVPSVAATAAPGPLSLPVQGVRDLALRNVNTGERLAVAYYKDGVYSQAALRQIAVLMRDHREQMVHPVDPRLVDILWAVRVLLRTGETFLVTSGYRTPRTNFLLAARDPNVAANSFHMRGRAVDIVLERRSNNLVAAAGLRLGHGGVGHYPGRGFTHLDTGPVRNW